MPHSAKAVANTFLSLTQGTPFGIDPMKMQKLLYFAHGWHLALTGRPLIDEYVEAWQYGPVVPSLYHDLKIYGSGPIQAPLSEYDFQTGQFTQPYVINDQYALSVINKVWEVYGNFSGLQLSDLTHQPGTPWEIARQENPSVRNADINNDMIRSYFIDAARQNREKNADR